MDRFSYFAYKMISRHPAFSFSESFYKKNAKTDAEAFEMIKDGFIKDKAYNYYIHIPFCKTLCKYCYCFRIKETGDDLHSRYLDHIRKELSLYSNLNGGKKLPYVSINIGGGTPNMLSDDNFEYLFSILNEFFKIDQEQRRVNIDINPSFLSLKKLDIIKRNCSRVSIGIQTFNKKLLDESERFIDNFDKYDIYFSYFKKNRILMNIDLLIGLAHQTEEDVDHAIKKSIKLGIDNISLNYFHKKDGLDYGIDERGIDLISKITRKWNNIILKYNSSENKQITVGSRTEGIIGIGVGAVSHLYGKFGFYRNDFERYYRDIDSGLITFDKHFKTDGYLEAASFFFDRILQGLDEAEFAGIYQEEGERILSKTKKLINSGVLSCEAGFLKPKHPGSAMPKMIEELLGDEIDRGCFGEIETDEEKLLKMKKDYSLYFMKDNEYIDQLE